MRLFVSKTAASTYGGAKCVRWYVWGATAPTAMESPSQGGGSWKVFEEVSAAASFQNHGSQNHWTSAISPLRGHICPSDASSTIHHI